MATIPTININETLNPKNREQYLESFGGNLPVLSYEFLSNALHMLTKVYSSIWLFRCGFKYCGIINSGGRT
jgi:hypothetical protein